MGSSRQLFIVLHKLFLEINGVENKFLTIVRDLCSYEVKLIIESALDTFINLEVNDTDQTASVREKVKKLL